MLDFIRSLTFEDVVVAIIITILVMSICVWLFDLGRKVYRWYKREQLIAQQSFAASKRDMKRMKIKQPVGYKPKDYKPMEYSVRDQDFLESCTAYRIMNTPAERIR